MRINGLLGWENSHPTSFSDEAYRKRNDQIKEICPMKLLRHTVVLLMILLLAVACRQQTVSAENINIDIKETDSLVGETTMIVTVTDADGNAIENPGTLSLRGDMDHAGMLPVMRESKDSTEGVFVVPFEWTMGGTWSVEVILTLGTGDVVTESFDFEILTEASEDGDMQGMDMDSDSDSHDMEDMDMGGETSAVYMSITNNGQDTVIIVGIQTDVAQLAELHETVIENDIARMQPVESLVIEAGETLELTPGRIHIMLMQLTQDIVTDESIELSLMLESGDMLMVTAVVQDMLMDDLEATTEVDDLVIRNVWARPASAGDLSTMDMESDDTDSDMHNMHNMEMATEEPDSD